MNNKHLKSLSLAKQILVAGIIFSLFSIYSCKKNFDETISNRTSPTKQLITNNQDEVEMIENFIINVNLSYSDPTQVFEDMDIDMAVKNIEHAINYSFSKPNNRFVKQFKNDTYTFEFENQNVSFNQVATKSKQIATYLKTLITSKNKLVVASINKIENANNSYRLTLILGEIDQTVELTSTPTPETTQGDHNWSYGENVNFNLKCQPGDIGAVEIIKDLGTKLMIAHRNYGINQIGITAPPGYTIYFDNYTQVSVGGIREFGASDVAILSKFDWNNSYSAYCQSNSRTPYTSPVFYVRTESIMNSDSSFLVTFPCYIPQNATDYLFKCCLNESFINYSISKVDDIYEYLSPASKHLFTYFEVIPYATDVYGGPIQHRFKYYKSSYYAKFDNPNITL